MLEGQGPPAHGEPVPEYEKEHDEHGPVRVAVQGNRGGRGSFFRVHGGKFAARHVFEHGRNKGPYLRAVTGDDVGNVLRVEHEAQKFHLPCAEGRKSTAHVSGAAEVHDPPVRRNARGTTPHGYVAFRAMTEGGSKIVHGTNLPEERAFRKAREGGGIINQKKAEMLSPPSERSANLIIRRRS